MTELAYEWNSCSIRATEELEQYSTDEINTLYNELANFGSARLSREGYFFVRGKKLCWTDDFDPEFVAD